MKRLLLAFLFTLATSAIAEDGGLASLRQSGKAFAAVARKVSPAVVFIQVESRDEATAVEDGYFPGSDLLRRFFGDDIPGLRRHSAPRKPEVDQASGFVFAHGDGKSYILTNDHVVEAAGTIRVKLLDGREFDASVKGSDPKSDIAVLEVAAPDLPALDWGDSNQLEVGEWVVAIGNPFGLSHTLTVGVVSAKGRSSIGINDYEDFIQTDAAINPGNSGGPLVNLDGQVVGMNTAIFSRSGGHMGVGFAIPSALAGNIAAQLVANGQVVRGYIGLAVQPLGADQLRALGLEGSRGLLVNRVNPGSPGERSGLRVGDVLLGMDGVALADGGHYRNRTAQAIPGTRVVLNILREGRQINVPVQVGRMRDQDRHADALGLEVRSLSAEEARRLHLTHAVLVTAVEPGGLAALAGIQPGTLVLDVDGHPVGTPEEFAATLQLGRDRSLIHLWERGRSRYVTLRWR